MHDFTFENRSYLGEFEAAFKKALARESGEQGELFYEKTEGQKSRDLVLLKMKHRHLKKFSDRPFKSCDDNVLRLFEVKSEAPFAVRKISSAACHQSILYSGGAKDKNSFYLLKGNFPKIVAFKGAIRKFLNILVAHIEGLRNPSTCLFDKLFSCQCP
jgi:hypothetical protein